MKTSKIISIILIFMIIGILVTATMTRVTHEHNEKLLLVSEKKIIEASEKCILEEKCSQEDITLKNLIDEGYIDKQVHPITKEYIDESLPITCNEQKCNVDID